MQIRTIWKLIKYILDMFELSSDRTLMFKQQIVTVF